METTLRKISKCNPCCRGWKLLLRSLSKNCADNDPLNLLQILESNGIKDAIWALRSITGHDNAIRLFTCFCAKYSLDIFERFYPDDKRPRQAIEIAEKFAYGHAAKKEMVVAGVAAGAAAWATTPAVAGAAAWATTPAVAGAAAEAAAWAAAEAVAKAAAWATGAAAWATTPAAAEAAAWEYFKQEFLLLCNLEGKYANLD